MQEIVVNPIRNTIAGQTYMLFQALSCHITVSYHPFLEGFHFINQVILYIQQFSIHLWRNNIPEGEIEAKSKFV